MADKLVVLRKGDDWKLPNQDRASQPIPISTMEGPSFRRATDQFSELAKAHGSAAIWLSETGYLVTEDPNEAARKFPYEEWRDQALKETGHL